MRRRILQFDTWLCLIISVVIALGTGILAKRMAKSKYDDAKDEHKPTDGMAGAVAGDDVFRAESIEDILSHDTFTIVSYGIKYRNDGAGYYGGMYLYNVELPNGERVAARVNSDSVQSLGKDIFAGDTILPIGCVVHKDLSSDKTFLSQIESKYDLSRTDFYIDMVGKASIMSEDDAVGGIKVVVQVLTVIICYPLLHALGSKLGLFSPYFTLKKKSEK